MGRARKWRFPNHWGGAQEQGDGTQPSFKQWSVSGEHEPEDSTEKKGKGRSRADKFVSSLPFPHRGHVVALAKDRSNGSDGIATSSSSSTQFNEFVAETSAFDFAKSSNVTVNQRQLVDKMLARYSTKYGGVLRELLQNADDAGAATVDIHLQKARDNPAKIARLIVANDGRPFNDNDWARITRIAEGNPMESTVGMFGVGFYSVFSLTDQPVVKSANQMLSFRWNKDQLVFARKPIGSLVTTSNSQNRVSEERVEGDHQNLPTQVFCQFKSPQRWDLDEVSQTLLQSILFTRNVAQLRLTCDGSEVFRVQKSIESEEKVVDRPLPKSFASSSSFASAVAARLMPSHPASARSNEGLFHTANIRAHDLVLRVWHTPQQAHSSSLFRSASTTSKIDSISPKVLRMRLVQAHVDVSAPQEFDDKVERVLRKRLPRSTTVSLLYDKKVAVTTTVLSSSPPRLLSNTAAAAAIDPGDDSGGLANNASRNGGGGMGWWRWWPRTRRSTTTASSITDAETTTVRTTVPDVEDELLRCISPAFFTTTSSSNTSINPGVGVVAAAASLSSLAASTFSFLQRQYEPSVFAPVSSSSSPTPHNSTSGGGGNGRIFVGMSTSQTTGAKFHLCAAFFPTVERELIDFGHPVLAKWNIELLSISGAIARAFYDHSMIQLAISQPSPSPDAPSSNGGSDSLTVSTPLMVQATHLLLSHLVGKTAPQPLVGELLFRNFLQPPQSSSSDRSTSNFSSSSSSSLLIPTTVGIRPAPEAFDVPAHPLHTIVGRRWAVVPSTLGGSTRSGSRSLAELLRVAGVRPFQAHDLKRFLSENEMRSTEEFVQMVKLCVSHPNELSAFIPMISLNRNSSTTATSMVLRMKNVRFYLPNSPAELPIPPSFLPTDLVDALGVDVVHRGLGLQKTKVLHWMDWLSRPEQRATMETSSANAMAAVLGFLSAHYNQVCETQTFHRLMDSMKNCRCIPTTQGMQYPSKTYLPSVASAASAAAAALSSPLPQRATISMRCVDGSVSVVTTTELQHNASPVVTRQLLRHLGVQNSPDVGDIRKTVQALGSSTAVVRHFSSVSGSMDESDWAQLRQIRFLPTTTTAAASAASHSSSSSSSSSSSNNNSESGDAHEPPSPPTASLFGAVLESVKRAMHRVPILDRIASVTSHGGDEADKDHLKAAPELYFASDLLTGSDHTTREPLEAYLHSHVLHFPGLVRGSDEWRFLKQLGVKELPTLSDVLGLMGDSSASAPSGSSHAKQRQAAAASAAIEYLARHFDSRYRFQYDAAEQNAGNDGKTTTTMAFVPCTDGQMRRPTECFAEDTGGVFAVIQPQFVDTMKANGLWNKLRLSQHPDMPELLTALKDRPPQTPERAQALLRYIARRKATLTAQDWKLLSGAKILPLTAAATATTSSPPVVAPTEWIAPSNAILYSESTFQRYGALLDYVRLGDSVNHHHHEEEEIAEVLEKAGAQRTPLPSMLLDSFIRNHQRFWNSTTTTTTTVDNSLNNNNNHNVEAYYNVLRELAAVRHLLKPQTLATLSELPCLLGCSYDDQTQQMHWDLYPARSCFLIDNTSYQRMLRVPAVPNEPQLQDFYRALGSKWLSQCVKATTGVQGRETKTTHSAKLAQLIKDREHLLLCDEFGHRHGDLRVKSLAHALDVRAVPAIRTSVTFEGKKFEFENESAPTCTLGLSSSSQRPTLYITTKGTYDSWDVATALSRFLYAKPSLDKTNRIESLLFASEESLRRKGYVVRSSSSSSESPQTHAGEAPPVRQPRDAHPSDKTKQNDSPSLSSPHPPRMDRTDSGLSSAPVPVDKAQNENWMQRWNRVLFGGGPNAAISGGGGGGGGAGSAPRPSQSPVVGALRDEEDGANTESSSRGGGGEARQQQRPVVLNRGQEGGSAGAGNQTRQRVVREGEETGNNADERMPNFGAAAQDGWKGAQGLVAATQALGRNEGLPSTLVTKLSRPNERPVPDLAEASLPTTLERLGTYSGFVLYGQAGVQLTSEHEASANEFAAVLRRVGSVFGLNEQQMVLFLDADSRVKAFNRDRRLFFNLRFYHQAQRTMVTPDELLTSWFITTCHELAHNRYGIHDYRHENEMQNLIQQFFPRFRQLLNTTSDAASVRA